MKGPAIVKRRGGMCFRFKVTPVGRKNLRGVPCLPPHWSPKLDADVIARIRRELRLEEQLMMLNVRFVPRL